MFHVWKCKKRRNLLTRKISGRVDFWGTYARNMQNKKTKWESITSWHRSFFPRCWLQILLVLKPLEDFSSNLRPCWHQKCNGIAGSAATRNSRSDDVIGTSGRFPAFHGHSQFTGSNSTTQSLASSLSGFLSACQSRSLGCRLNWMSIRLSPPFNGKLCWRSVDGGHLDGVRKCPHGLGLTGGCLKMGYTPNYSHLVGIMIINHWV